MLTDNDFKYLLDTFDRPWKGYRKVRKGVMKKVRRHMRQLNCNSVTQYVAILQQNTKEYATCQSLLRVTISRFYRDREVWRNISDVLLPELLARYPQTIRVWSAGCACGEEAYSFATLWREKKIARNVEIIASDADEICLDRARLGQFTQSSLKELPQAINNSCFEAVEGGFEFKILPHLQKDIQWFQHDLRDKPPFGSFHLIFLRNNMLTYYCGPDLTSSLLRILATLLPGGFLVVGSHENFPDHHQFSHYIQCFPSIYQKNGSWKSMEPENTVTL